MALSLKERLLKILNGKDEVKKDEPKQLTLTDAELNELVEKRANELLDKELATLDKAFLKEVSEGMKSIKVDEPSKEQTQLQEDKVKEILNNKETKE